MMLHITQVAGTNRNGYGVAMPSRSGRKPKALLSVVGGLALAFGMPGQARADNDRWSVEAIHGEIGAFGGVLFLPSDHQLFDADGGIPQRALQDVSATFGARAAFYPASFLGIEAEGTLTPTNLSEGNGSAWLYRAGGHVVLQYPARFSVFALGGMGIYGIQSDADVQGDDLDIAAHWGAGVKFFITENFGLRVDGRQILTGWAEQDAEDGEVSLHYEVLAGLTFAFGRHAGVAKDTDRDGVIDANDACPIRAGDAADGCPIPDADKDGVSDKDDKCPAVAAATPDGCPTDGDEDGVPDATDQCPARAASTDNGCPDSDGDGVSDDKDACVDQAGTLPNGCVDPDPDKDGLSGDQDMCPEKAGLPTNGCPKEVQDLLTMGRDIKFRSGRARIASASLPVLNRVFTILKSYPELKLEIRGHTDSAGNADANLRLSQLRANVVRAYLIDLGIDRKRLTALGYGEAVPIANNRTRAGRAKNRRIEFQLQK